MPVFGIRAPEDSELFAAAADFCRHNGLRFMELGEACPVFPAEYGEGLVLLPFGSALELCLRSTQEMEAFLESLPLQQPVLLKAESRDELARLVHWVNYWLNRRSAAGELWDIYDENRRKTGALHPRGEELGEGEYHLVVHVWIRNSAGQYLLTKRSLNKGYGGMWESPGGAARAGDDSLSACLREIREETGLELNPSQGRIVESYRGDHYFCDVWLFIRDFSLDEVVLQEGETCDKMLATREQILAMAEKGTFVPFLHLDKVLNIE